jgi:2-dehydro-3-deoxyphosphogluconate aldolase/(4S)-4-hydroxy-2-oxoglutarate aldolase
MDKQQVIQSISKYKIIAIARNVPADAILKTADALYEGGIRLIEVTFNQQAAPTDTAKAIKALSSTFEGKMLIGAGTVLSVEQVELAAEAGGKYIISPNVDQDVIRRTNELGLVSIPGAFTPSEVVSARNSGADFVKLFPAGELGIGYIKALRAPINHIPMLAVGGVDQHNLKDFLAAGIQGVGIGSNIVSNKLINAGNFAGLTELAKAYTEQL